MNWENSQIGTGKRAKDWLGTNESSVKKYKMMPIESRAV